MIKKTYPILAAFLILFIASTRSAHAYLDPGSGSYILQLLIAGGVGVLFTVKTFWQQIMNFLANLFSRSNKETVQEKDKKNDRK